MSDFPPTAVRHMLVLVTEIGPDSACTSANPYRGTIGELQLLR